MDKKKGLGLRGRRKEEVERRRKRQENDEVKGKMKGEDKGRKESGGIKVGGRGMKEV